VALAQAAAKGERDGRFAAGALRGAVAGVSVGLVGGRVLLDLDYAEDSAAEVDVNVAMTSSGRYVEVQASGEGRPFDGRQLEAMLRLARRGIRALLVKQRRAAGRKRT